MNLIASVDRNWAIGYQGKLLVRIPSDMKQFREKTTGKVIVLGRKTLMTFPGEQPLPNRTNIILSRNPDFRVKGALTAASTEALFEMLKAYPSEDVFVIGGESAYAALADHCDTAYLTRLDYAYSADAYFPDLSRYPEWRMTEESEEMTCFDIEYRFEIWKKHIN
ncbi:MAG: dihydrofolate reductase [Lachnospiraceae bacterium]|nr:dihydrofolate reductase [Lachnospiraceae bacterium]